jgi:hypothetical protein
MFVTLTPKSQSQSLWLRLERRGAEIRIHAHHVRAQFTRDSSEFGHDGFGVVDQRFVVVERDVAHLIRREPEREVARVMLDEEATPPQSLNWL